MKLIIDLACKTICVKDSIKIKDLMEFINTLKIDINEWCIVGKYYYETCEHSDHTEIK